MSYETYRLIHIGSLFLLFLALGGILLSPADAERRPPRFAVILHGIGLLAVLVAGFGLLAKQQIAWPWPAWVFGKLGVWLLLGVMPTLLKKGIVTRAFGWIVAIALGIAGAWLALNKPVF